ncbi:hypothetical protein [Mesorhizobium sp. CA12]|uniref:hypothetical protein n=1 Tax=Mesorhizobium sp. CA12 TaxID=2876644 RepID=UPI0021E2CC2F|nr:hypothetical protein [Mesorhizobium sp. CA12]
MTALAFLSKLSADLRRSAWSKPNETSQRVNRRLIRMTALVPSVPEIRYLLARILIFPPTQKPFIIAWSLWRRRHQAAASILSLQTARISATVVLMPKIEDLAGSIATSIVRVDGVMSLSYALHGRVPPRYTEKTTRVAVS